jgi:serine/threonine protein kinase
MIDQSTTLPVGTLLHGTYRVEEYLSSGGFGNTYVVTNVEFEESYALKEFFMKGISLREGHTTVSVSIAENRQQFDAQKEKFKKEARRLRKLQSKHIVRVHDLFEENGTAYYVMDLIDGESLSATMKRQKRPLTEAEVWPVLSEVLSALKTVHSQQIWHLDLKPGNIMTDHQGRVVLIDFGASKQMDASQGYTGTSTALCYTPGYAPSEQIDGNIKRIGPWTDFYALGATLYKLVTMQQPPSPSRISEEKTGAFSFPATVSELCRNLIYWMMTPNRTKRPQTVGEIRQYLKEGGGTKAFDSDDDDTTFHRGKSSAGKGQTPTPRRPVPPPTRKQEFNPLYVLIGVVVVLGIVLAVWLSSKNKDGSPIPAVDTTQVENSVGESNASVQQTNEQTQEEATSVTEEEPQDNIKHYGHDLSSAQHHHLVGYFYDNNNRKWPVQLDFNSGNDQITNVVYRNVGTGGRISMTCTSFNGTDMELVSRDGSNLSMSLEMNGAGEFSGMATQGATTLNVSMSPQCSHE